MWGTLWEVWRGHTGGEVTGLLWSGNGRWGKRLKEGVCRLGLLAAQAFSNTIMSLQHLHLSAPLPAWNEILTHHWSQHVAPEWWGPSPPPHC